MAESNVEFEFVFARRPVQWIIVCTIAILMLGIMPARFEFLPTTAGLSKQRPHDPPRISTRAGKLVTARLAGVPFGKRGDGANRNDALASGWGIQQRRWIIQINLNSANAPELSLLPGVGPVLAKRIVSDRVSIGSFETVDDLQRVRGIGPRKMAEIREMAIVTH